MTREASIAAASNRAANQPPGNARSPLCREYLRLDPGSVDHLRLLGRALGKQGRYADAEQAIRRAISLQPGLPHLHEDLGSVFALQQRVRGIRCAASRRRSGSSRNCRPPHKKLGKALAALGRGREADAAFEEYFRLDADKGQVALALDHLYADRKDEAIATLRDAVRKNPDNVDALRYLAEAYYGDEEHVADVEALLRRATSLTPGLCRGLAAAGLLAA